MDTDPTVGHRAAIYGLRSKKDLSIFILHPKNRISPIQEAQMCSVTDDNVFNIAIEGTFDDCQVSFLSIYSKHVVLTSIGCIRILSKRYSPMFRSTELIILEQSTPSTGLEFWLKPSTTFLPTFRFIDNWMRRTRALSFNTVSRLETLVMFWRDIMRND